VPANRGTRRRRPAVTIMVLLASFVALTVLATGSPATAGPPVATGPTYVKYYLVTASYQGAPENLAEIAGRFLNSTDRGGEILQLNSGVVQADGGNLTDPATLHAGWVLTLPWDAVGTGVQYGLLPTSAPPAAEPPAAPPAAPPAKKPITSVPAKPPAAATGSGGCATTPKSAGGAQSQWAMLRLAPDHAWTYSRGGGVLVAVVDSGVDATRPELAGHVTVGADIVAGTGRGDVDCLGSGTAMAGIVAARSDAGGTFGMAPDATVMPVRIAPTSAAVAEADQASAIEVAVSAGVKVIALGGYVDLSKPAVASAVEFAAGHDVLVVAGASPQSATPAGAAGAAPAGLLRVGAINIDGGPAVVYQPGAVDVVAPGVDVTSLGISGTGQVQSTGTPYAVAFVAGEAALVRSMYPHLSVAQVVRRIEATADRMGSTAPDATFGWGLIDPGVAVTRVIPDEGRGPAAAPPAPGGGWSSLRTKALIVVVLLALAMVLLLVLRIRRMVRVAPTAAPGLAGEPGVGAPATPGPMAGADELVTAVAPISALVSTPAAVATTPAVVGGSGVEASSVAVGASARGAPAGRVAASTVERQDPAAAPDTWWRHGPNGA
jgi:membrane-anchored mycosin MYCP